MTSAAARDNRIMDAGCTERGADRFTSCISSGGKQVGRCEAWRVAIDPCEEFIASAKASAIGAGGQERAEFCEGCIVARATGGYGATRVIGLVDRAARGVVKQLIARAQISATNGSHLLRVGSIIIGGKERGVGKAPEVDDGARVCSAKENPIGKRGEWGALSTECEVCAAQVKYHIALQRKCNRVRIQQLPTFRRSMKDRLAMQCSKIHTGDAGTTEKFHGFPCVQNAEFTRDGGEFAGGHRMLVGGGAQAFGKGAKGSRSFRQECGAHGQTGAVDTGNGEIDAIDARTSHCSKDEAGSLHECGCSQCGACRSSMAGRVHC
jgi:hypothetical protein